MTAVYNSVADEDQQLIENKEIFDEQAEKNVLQQKLSASGISLYEMRPSDSYNQLDLIIDGLAFTSDDGLVQTFTAPYDGDYTITAYGANGGTGKGKYQGYRTPGRGGKAEGTIHLNAGQTIHIYLGEAGGYWSTNRTFGGGGGQIDWDRAWFPDEDKGQTDRYHVFGRGGGATYVTVDAWTMDQAGEAAHDYTDAEKAQNDAAAEVAKNHVILLAGGGGGMGESGGTAGGGGVRPRRRLCGGRSGRYHRRCAGGLRHQPAYHAGRGCHRLGGGLCMAEAEPPFHKFAACSQRAAGAFCGLYGHHLAGAAPVLRLPVGNAGGAHPQRPHPERRERCTAAHPAGKPQPDEAGKEVRKL